MRFALVIALRDLRERLRDRSALVIAFIMPLAIAWLMGFALGGLGRGVHMNLAVVDLDGSELSQSFAADVTAAWPDEVAIVGVESGARARDLLDAQEVHAAVVLPAGLANGGDATVEVITRPGASMAGRMTRMLARDFAARAYAPGAAPRSRPRSEGRPLRVLDFMAASMAVLFMNFAILAGMHAFQAEQDGGTFRRLAATPAPRGAILAGKFGSLYLLGAIQLCVMVAATSWLFGTDWGAPLPVAALVATSVLAGVGLVSFFVALVDDAERGRTLAMILIFLLAVVGGQFMPPAGLPDFFDVMARLTPNGQAARGFVDLASAGAGAPLSTVAEPLLVTGGVGLAGLGYAVTRARVALGAGL